MLTVTATARERLTQKLTRKKASDGQAMRLTHQSGGWKLTLDRARPDDTTFSHQGKHVLLLDKKVSRAARHMVLDARPTAAGPRLTLNRSTAHRDPARKNAQPAPEDTKEFGDAEDHRSGT